MPSTVQVPAEYVPYETVVLCGNTLRAVNLPFQVGTHPPLLIGRGADRHPSIWLSAPDAKSGVWVELVSANTVIGSSVLPAQRVMVVLDAMLPQTVIILGSVVVVNAVGSEDGTSVNIPTIDLRPVGLNISGNEIDGLNFGGNVFKANTMINVATAFA